MATAREYLQSILKYCGDLQEMDDDQLNSIVDDLAEVDDLLSESVAIAQEAGDGAPCCPDPGCPGRGRGAQCTFPGYADNH